ncbi:MAG: exonuclease domain-containing protein [Luteibaculum sp.]
MKFAVVDIETSGFSGVANKITEIAIYVVADGKIQSEYSSLVNPQTFIPRHITQLTGIDAEMLKDAPLFEDIADRVDALTQDCIFVAHSVHFDFGIIQEAFKKLGRTFERKKLCTVRYARQVIPQHKSYSLGNICRDLGVSISNRHRAAGDARATVDLLQTCLDADEKHEILKKMLNRKSRELTLPPHLDKDVFNELPEEAGVYYFLNEQQKIIYVGKAKNIKKRVLSHFYQKGVKNRNMLLQIADIQHKKTGTELLALLIESAEIKKYYPRFNSAQKKSEKLYQLVSYENQAGYLQLGLVQKKLGLTTHYCFENKSEAHSTLLDLVERFGLSLKLCAAVGNDISTEQEPLPSPDYYNQQVRLALNSLDWKPQESWIELPGRNEQEKACIKIEQGEYRGYAFVPKGVENTDLEKFLIPQKSTLHSHRILQSYFLNPKILV